MNNYRLWILQINCGSQCARCDWNHILSLRTLQFAGRELPDRPWYAKIRISTSGRLAIVEAARRWKNRKPIVGRNRLLAGRNRAYLIRWMSESIQLLRTDRKRHITLAKKSGGEFAKSPGQISRVHIVCLQREHTLLSRSAEPSGEDAIVSNYPANLRSVIKMIKSRKD